MSAKLIVFAGIAISTLALVNFALVYILSLESQYVVALGGLPTFSSATVNGQICDGAYNCSVLSCLASKPILGYYNNCETDDYKQFLSRGVHLVTFYNDCTGLMDIMKVLIPAELTAVILATIISAFSLKRPTLLMFILTGLISVHVISTTLTVLLSITFMLDHHVQQYVPNFVLETSYTAHIIVISVTIIKLLASCILYGLVAHDVANAPRKYEKDQVIRYSLPYPVETQVITRQDASTLFT